MPEQQPQQADKSEFDKWLSRAKDATAIPYYVVAFIVALIAVVSWAIPHLSVLFQVSVVIFLLGIPLFILVYYWKSRSHFLNAVFFIGGYPATLCYAWLAYSTAPAQSLTGHFFSVGCVLGCVLWFFILFHSGLTLLAEFRIFVLVTFSGFLSLRHLIYILHTQFKPLDAAKAKQDIEIIAALYTSLHPVYDTLLNNSLDGFDAQIKDHLAQLKTCFGGLSASPTTNPGSPEQPSADGF